MAIKRRHGPSIVVAAIALLFLAAGSAQARVGELDPGFGEGGRAFVPLKSGSYPMASAPDGSILILSEGQVGRLSPDGQLDPSFGVGGLVTLGDIDGLRFRTSDIAVDSLGRVLVFGTTSDPSRSVDPQLMYTASVEASWATVVRLDPRGQLDPGFGDGRGFVRSDLGLPATFAPDLPTLRIGAGEVDSQNRPVFVATEAEKYSPCYGHLSIGWRARAIARLTVAGHLDATFGRDGLSPFDALSNPAFALDAADGVILAGANVSCQSDAQGGIAVHRLGADGAASAGFGAGGVRLYPNAWRFATAGPSGEMLLEKGRRPAKTVLRTAPDGGPDRRFGRNGWAAVTPSAGAQRAFRAVAVDARGRVLIAGSLVLPKPNRRTKSQRAPRSFFVVARLLPSGKPDLGFGKRGSILTPLGWPPGVVAEEAFLDPQGRLVVAGPARKRGRLAGLVLRRYLLGP